MLHEVLLTLDSKACRKPCSVVDHREGLCAGHVLVAMRLCSGCRLWPALLHQPQLAGRALALLIRRCADLHYFTETGLKAFVFGKCLPENPSISPVRVRQECAALWAAGRQQCEAVSLTGRACRLAPHGASAAHCSGARLLLASQDGTSRCCSAQTWWLYSSGFVWC